jgi:prolyl oligopeptidase
MAEPVREVLHGIEVDDPFRWLEDQDSPATRSFIEAEQRIYREYLNHHRVLRSKVERRVAEMLTAVNVDLPVSDHRGGLLYLKREAEAEQRGIYYQDEAGVETLLISVEMLGMDFFASLAIIQISQDSHYFVFGIRIGGEDVQEVGIYDLTERQLLPDRLLCGFYRGLVFESDGRGFYYVQEERKGRYQLRRAVRRHRFGDNQSNDLEIYHAGEAPTTRLILQGAEDASGLGYLIVSLESVPTTRFLIHRFPLSEQPQEIVHLSDASFGPRFWASRIEASTTFVSPLGRIVHINLEHPEPSAWSDIIPEGPESIYCWEQWEEFRVIHYTAGCRRLSRIYSRSGKLIRTIEFPGTGTVTLGQVDSHSRSFFYSHSDITEPPAIYAVDLRTGEHRLWWQQQTSIRQEDLDVESLAYSSKDGTEIPITLIHPRSAQGVRPTLLCAYGGGGVSATPKFSVLLTILIEAGFTCATAHVRGGGEGGLEWHLAARKQRKQVSVDDLLSAGEWLIEKGLSTQSHLGLAGQSSGALLALCALTQRPHLFRAAMALGPIADLTRFHLFGVARGSIPELGSPTNPDEFAALYQLSPYHRVNVGTIYPAVLIISGDRDKRCDSLHARKMAARLRQASARNHPVLLDYTDSRGHKPVLPLSERIRALTHRLTFLIAELSFSDQEEPES